MRPFSSLSRSLTKFLLLNSFPRSHYHHTCISPVTMHQFTLRPHDIPITVPDGLSESQLLSFRPFNNWLKQLQSSLALQQSTTHPFHSSPYSLNSIAIQSYDLFSESRVGFIKLSASVSNKQGESLPGIALLRGPSVAMLFMLVPDDVDTATSDERYVVLTVQPRVPIGSLGFVELPAGMLDDEGSLKGAAAKEIEEELGVTIHESELTSLSELAGAGPVNDAQGQGKDEEDLAHAMFPSAGGCDEHIAIFSHERRIPREQLNEWEGRLTGLRSHGEKITLKVVPMKDLWKIGARDAKCLAALALWQNLRQEKKIYMGGF